MAVPDGGLPAEDRSANQCIFLGRSGEAVWVGLSLNWGTLPTVALAFLLVSP